jgi:hypothetical protein
MKLSIGTLLGKLCSKNDYDAFGIDAEEKIEGIKLFSSDEEYHDPDDCIYLVSASRVKTHTSTLISRQVLSHNIYLCVMPERIEISKEITENLSIIFLYTKESYISIFNQILQLFHKFTNWEESLSDAMLRNMELQEIIDICKGILTCPLVILDRSYRAIGAYKPEGIDPPIFRDVEEKGYLTSETVHTMIRLGVIPMSNSIGLDPTRQKLTHTASGEYYSYWEQIQVNGHVVAYMLWLLEDKEAFEREKYLISYFTDSISRYFQNGRYNSSASSDMKESLLIDIMDHPLAPAASYKERVKMIMYMEMEGEFLLSKIEYDNKEHLPYELISWHLHNLSPDYVPFVYKDSLYLFMPYHAGDSGERLSETAEKRRKEIEELFQDTPFTMASSDPFFSLMDLSKAAEQCSIALLYRNLSHKRTEHFIEFRDILLLFLAKRSVDSFHGDLLITSEYKILRKFDAEHNNNLTDVMFVYLTNRQNINKTAEKLFMHRNTVMNKVKKASALVNNSFQNFHDSASFIISYYFDVMSSDTGNLDENTMYLLRNI